MNGQTFRIYAHASPRLPLARPRPRATPPVLRLVEDREPAADSLACEPEVMAILTRTAAAGETIEVAYRRKEQALARVFGALSADDARVVHRRLSEARTDDTLAQQFARLVIDRRMRLLAILADAPRREARRR